MTPLHRLALVLVGGLVAACGAGAREAPAEDRPPGVLVFCMDTVRADRMALYGGPRPTTPRLARLAERGLRFDDAQAPSPWTLPSVASVLTGRFPSQHGARLAGELRDLRTMPPSDLAADVPTLTEQLAGAGYRCEAFVTNPVVRGGLQRGFHAFTYRNTEGADVTRWAVEALGRLRDEPFFLWLHFMDAHDPLLVPADHVQAVTRAEGEAKAGKDWARTMIAHALPGFREERLVLYDAAVHYVDEQIGRVLDELQRLGLNERTLVVVLSDHGEEMLDHLEAARAAGYRDPRGIEGVGHGHTLFREQLHVPLVLAGPGVPRGSVAALVSLADVAPTLLELVGLGGAACGDGGRSLVPLFPGTTEEAGAAWPERALEAGSLAYGPDRHALLTERWKLIRGGAGEATLLYDRRADPGELLDLSQAQAAERAALEERLEALRSARPARTGAPLPFGGEDVDVLRALGYLGDDGQDDG